MQSCARQTGPAQAAGVRASAAAHGVEGGVYETQEVRQRHESADRGEERCCRDWRDWVKSD